jgi:hypothetical protein
MVSLAAAVPYSHRLLQHCDDLFDRKPLPLHLGRVLLRRILPEARSQAVSFRGADHGKVASTLRYLLGAGQNSR